MRKVFGLMLLSLLFSCETENLVPELKFNGLIKDGDLATTVPVSNIKVKIIYYGEGTDYISMDSTLTDSNGKYSFSKLNRDGIKKYFVHVDDEFIEKCNDPYPMPATRIFIFPKDVDELNVNHDTINICLTGKIKLTLTKLDVTAKDTLTISPVVKTKSADIISISSKISESAQWTNQFFTKTVTSVEYKFSLKKENGEVTGWVIERDIQPRILDEIKIEF
ncbi:MAG: hypothetical protein KF845_00520 [Cyclobacteriaceae bacterium]|nr:hypothetical protein [Cyclobacteriaceae bacterium]